MAMYGSKSVNLQEAKKSTVFNAQGKAISFGQIFDQQDREVSRTLVVFIRHFFCGNCQEYVRRLSTELAPSSLPQDLSIVIIGCGAPSLISSYADLTKCPFTIYADPSTQLYKLLGMQRSLSLGSKDPAYIQHSLAAGVMKSIVQGIKRIPSGDVAKAGDLSVNGGEFLFTRKPDSCNWEISWSHCMQNSRDHSEINTIKFRLDLLSTEQQDEFSFSNLPQRTADADTMSCSDTSDDSCGKSRQAMTRSLSTKRRSWMVKAGQLTRAASLRRNMIHVS